VGSVAPIAKSREAVGVNQGDLELVRLGHIGRWMRFGFVAVVVLLLFAVAKPWLVRESAPVTGSSWPGQLVAALTTPAPSPSIRPGDLSSALCESQDGWRIVANYMESGLPARTSAVAAVEYSPVPPLRSSIPETKLSSKGGVESLGLCAPLGRPGSDGTMQSATLWRVGGGSAGPSQWQLAARLALVPGSRGALAYPLDQSDAFWLPGRYVLEARFVGSERDAWIGLVVEAAS
jgi:hypothetical protein